MLTQAITQPERQRLLATIGHYRRAIVRCRIEKGHDYAYLYAPTINVLLRALGARLRYTNYVR